MISDQMMGIDIKLLHGMLKTLKWCMESSVEFEELKRLTDMGFYISATFSAGLRGNELLESSREKLD